MSSPLRIRLTLWYVGAFSVVLILFSTGVYFFVERTLVERMDANLRVTLQTTGSALARDTNQSMPLTEALEDPRFPGQIVALVDTDGRVLARNRFVPRWSSASPLFLFVLRHRRSFMSCRSPTLNPTTVAAASINW